MFSSFYWKFFCRVVVDHFWHTFKGRAILAQNVFLFGFCQLHVHKPLVAPVEREKKHENTPCKTTVAMSKQTELLKMSFQQLNDG